MKKQNYSILRFRYHKGGVIGFPEEIPGVIVIVISATILFLSCMAAFTTYITSHRTSEMTDQCYEILRAVRGSEDLLVTGTYTNEPTEGIFEFSKLENMTTEKMKMNITSKYSYNVTITELLGIENGNKIKGKTWSFGSPKPTVNPKNIVFMETLTVIRMAEDKYNLSMLIVVIW
ncbi:MAG: hypothetical protein AB1779_03840 [Candidatus Thermoplasmatota archaeon]